jgi:hypothetical protein
MGISDFVAEQTDRLPYYDTIAMLLAADGLILPGSDSPGYTASKLFPYIMAKKLLLAIFHEESSTVSILRDCSPGSSVFTFPGKTSDDVVAIYGVLERGASGNRSENPYDVIRFSQFSARNMTHQQVLLFNQVLSGQ